MPEFLFTAKSADQQLHSGELQADNLAAARAELESQGFVVVSLTQLSNEVDLDSAIGQDVASTGRSFETTEHFDRQLLADRIAEFVEQRKTLLPALEAWADELPAGPQRRRLNLVVAELQAGTDPEQLAAAEDAAEVWLPLLSSNSPYESIHSLSELLEETSRADAVRSKRWRIAAYPVIIFLMAAAVFAFSSYVVVPIYHEIFNDFGINLPTLTVWVLNFSDAMLAYPVAMLCLLMAVIALIYVGLQQIRKLQRSSQWFGALTNGNSSQVATMAEFVRRLAEGLKANLPLATCLRLAGRSCDAAWIRRDSHSLADSLIEDGELTLLPRTSLPVTVIYALRGSRNGGPNVRLLEELATSYTERLETRFHWAQGILPIAGILLVSLAVLLVVLALYLPLLYLVEGLTG